MQTKTLQQTVTFKASPQEVYDMLMDSKKHRSLSGEPAKISNKVGGKFTAWGSHLSGINLVLKPGRRSCRRGARQAGGRTTIPSQSSTSPRYGADQSSSYADRHPTKPLQRPLPWLDRDLLDTDEGNIRYRKDQREDSGQSPHQSDGADRPSEVSKKGVEGG